MHSFAIIKLSYNKIGDNDIEGGICGTGFFIDEKTFLTAHHVFNSSQNIPNKGYTNCQFWLASRTGEVFEIINPKIECHPNIDTTIIRFPTNITKNVIEMFKTLPSKNDKIYNHGYLPKMPKIDANWTSSGLIIKSVNLNTVHSDGMGTVQIINKESVNGNDVKLTNKTLIITSYPGKVGMSGGALFNNDNKVIGLMSFGYPPDNPDKNYIGAVWINEILKEIKKSE